MYQSAIRVTGYLTGVLALLAVFSQGVRAQLPEQKQMNVVFIAVDDLRPSVGAYGDANAKTPFMDRLAREGLIFSRAYCQQAVCNPSRASLLTGLRPDETGVVNLEDHFRDHVPGAVTLPQLFKNNGYLSLGVGKIFHPSKHTLDPVSWTNNIPEYKGGMYLLDSNQGKGKRNAYESADVEDEAYEDGQICRDALKYLKDAQQEEKPFFLAIGFKKPHAPFNAPKKYWDMYEGVRFRIDHPKKPAKSPRIAYHDLQEIRGYKNIPKEGLIPEEKQQKIWQGYYACISYVDAQIGKLLEAMDELDLRKNTIVVLWGDHGYHLGEQTSWCKSTNFEMDARVPLIVSVPGMPYGMRSDALVELVDLYPTLIDLCGISPAGKLSGVSLKPLLLNPEAEWQHVAFNQFGRPYDALWKPAPTYTGYSVRTNNWRCTYWYDHASGIIVEKELYHLKQHEIEKVNVSGKRAYAKMESKLAALIEEYRLGKFVKSSFGNEIHNY